MPLNQVKSFNQLSTKDGSVNGDYSKKEYKPSVQGIKFYNTDMTAIAKSGLVCSIWNGLLKFNIINGILLDANKYQWDNNNGTSIYFTPSKAKLFLEILKSYVKDPVLISGRGIVCGRSVITINNGVHFGKSNEESALRIIRFNNENNIDGEAAYEFNNDSYQVVTNIQIDHNVLSYDSKNYYKNIELYMIMDQLNHFIFASTGAYAYSVLEASNKSMQRFRNGIDNIIDKIGAEPAWKQINKSSNDY